MKFAAATLILTALAGGGCISADRSATLDEQRVCLEHYKNDPVERERCRLDARLRKGSPPDVRPQDLPVRTGAPSD